MINDYRIKIKNNEEVLYLYMNFDTEFSLSELRDNIDSFKVRISKFIKKNKINFKGTTVAIVVGGLMIGTISLNNIKYVDKSVVPNYIVSINNKVYFEDINKDNEIDNDILNNEVLELNTTNENQNQSNEVKNDNQENVNTVKNTVKSNANNKSNTVNKESSNVNQNNNVVNEENKSSGTIINLYRKNGSVVSMELDEYLIGVVGAEMPASFNIEALKAQAIVARTYTLKTINSGKKLSDDNSTQNYKSNEELKNTWGSSYNTYYNKVRSAVIDTKGIVIKYNGSLIDALYHSTSNGYTEDASNVWKNSVPYLKSVSSEYDTTNKNFIYNKFISYQDLSNKLGIPVSYSSNIEISEKTNSGRVKYLNIDGNIFNGVNVRTILELRSTDFVFEKQETGINIITKGYGHGVGMSQYGANGMANNGYSYKDIILHYYTGVYLDAI